MADVITDSRMSRRALIGCALMAVARPWRAIGAAADDVAFDAEGALRILRWAQTDGVFDPPAWRELLPYRLARDQATWGGAPNPDLEVEKQLTLIRERRHQGLDASKWTRSSALAERIVNGGDAFLATALPHLRAYLPSGTPLRGVIALAAFLPNYAFSMNDTIVVTITDRFWQDDPVRVFNLIVHELFHNGFIRHQQEEAPSAATNGDALLRNLLWTIQNEGLATYVAYRAKPRDLVLNDYRLLESHDAVRARFERCRALMDDLRRATASDLTGLRQRLDAEGNAQRVTYIVGASMAGRIEERAGRSALLETIERSPQAFIDTYRATSPPADLTV